MGYSKFMRATRLKRAKYKNKKVTIDGITFESTKEGNRYKILKLQQQIGHISNLEIQPGFTLQEKFKRQERTIRAVKYIADFQYKKNGQTITEDVKPSPDFQTPEYKLKKKLLFKKYPEVVFLEFYGEGDQAFL